MLTDASCDGDADVVAAAVTALGMLWDPRALPAIVRQAGHRSADVRSSVAVAIPGAVSARSARPDAIGALIALSADPDAEARDWATFGLGSQLEDQDTEAIRDALAARLDDPGEDTSGEALLGLAHEDDPRAPAGAARAPGRRSGQPHRQRRPPGSLVEGAPALQRLKREGWQLDDPRPSVLDDARRACATER